MFGCLYKVVLIVIVDSFSLPTVVFGFVLPFGMELSHVLLCDEIKIFLVDFLAIGVVVDSALSVAFDHILPEQSHRLVGDLSLSGTLFRRQQELDRILGTSGLSKQTNRQARIWEQKFTQRKVLR